MDNLEIFRAYDVRGIFGKDLTVEVMVNIGRAFGTYLIRKNMTHVTVGGDIRASTSILQQVLLSGISSTGISCDVVSKSPLGVTLFHSFSQNYAASAYITASHLPPEWNGVKFYWGPGIGFSPEENLEIQEIFEGKDFEDKDAFNIGTTTRVDPYQSFVDYLKSKFTIKKKFKVAIDCGNGATSLVIPQLYEELGFEVIPLFDTPDPKFPNRPSEPNEDSLLQLCDLVKKSKVDFAAGFDGDGDRCVIVDEHGTVISADEFAIITAGYLLNTRKNNRIVINIECSFVLEKYLKDLGADVKRIRVGHSFLSLEAKEMDAVFGVEASGHAIAPEIFLFDDALILPLLFAAALEFKEKSVSELTSLIDLPKKKRFDLKCSDKTKFRVVENITDFLSQEPGEVEKLDGISLTNDDGRILVRVSNTSPKIRATIESITDEGFNRLKEMYVGKIQSFIAEIN
ncbi:MAG: hypothetical protein FK732_02055 [Asgard group archaeon]|nr:hypothetical protein [Asgard group archaeon]